MKMHDRKMRVSVLALAVEGALLAMCAATAQAEDDEVAALIMPTNYIELGASYTSDSSAKFGEYTGLNDSGLDLIGNFNVSGGDAYGDGNGTTRWTVKGTDLGLTSRSLDASMSNQGKWNLEIGYDELRHNLTDGYQTPYLGKMGGNNFVLPATFGVVGGDTNSLSLDQQEAFHTVEVGTSRKNMSFRAGYIFNPQWDVKLDFNHLDQSGAKLMAFGTDPISGGDDEKVLVLPNPTNYQTDTVNLALNWKGDKGHVTGAYFGSFFRDGYRSVMFQNFMINNGGQEMTTPPSNDLHQLNLTGGYAFSPQTKLAGGLSYGRNTQNDAFVDSALMNGGLGNLPRSSLDGLVVTTHADLKLTNQTTKDLTLAAGITYNERNNKTDSVLYDFFSISGSNRGVYSNTPLSNRKTLVELSGDYRLDKNQHIRLDYNHEDVKRWCDKYAGNASTGITNANPPLGGPYTIYGANGNCVVATGSKDDKLGITYKLKASDDVNLNAGYSYSDRRTDSDPNAIVAMISRDGGSIAGINGGDYIGFYPYFDATRRQQLVKAGVNWQANDKLSLSFGGRYTNDDYYDSTYGVQKGNSWSLNLDVTYSLNENGSVSAYTTKQHREREMTNVQSSTTTPWNTWTNTLKDNDFTVGLGAKQGGLMGGKLELSGDLTYSLGETDYGTVLHYSTATPCTDPTQLTCGDLPTIYNRMIELKISGSYQVDKSAKVILGLIHKQLRSNDYFYNGYQYGYTPSSVLHTNQQSGSYSINAVAASYQYWFR